MILAFEAAGLRRGYGRTPVLRGVDLQLEPGRILGLAGANGSGKTTLLWLLATLMRPQAGRLAIFGGEQPATREQARRRIGVVGHSSFLYPQLTVEENMAFYGALFGLSRWRDRFEALLVRFDLQPYRTHLVSALSRGLLQRASLIRALLHEPELLLLDEPFTALDSGSVQTVTDVLRTWRTEGHAAVLTTHELARDLPLCDEVVTLRGGRVAERVAGGA